MAASTILAVLTVLMILSKGRIMLAMVASVNIPMSGVMVVAAVEWTTAVAFKVIRIPDIEDEEEVEATSETMKDEAAWVQDK